MTQQNPRVDYEVEALIRSGRVIEPVPDVVRARSLARARALMDTGQVLPPEALTTRRPLGRSLALAAGLLLVAGAAAAIAAWQDREQNQGAPRTMPAAAILAHPAQVKPALDPVQTPLVLPEETASRPARARRPSLPQESYAAELELLQRAQVQYAGGNYVAALSLCAEHGRRFSHGRLVEEREALRIHLLTSSGRVEDARRATATFAERFPRSVLLPKLRSELK